MAITFASLPRPVWTFSIAGFLHPRDLLQLRAVSRASQSFITSLLTELAAAYDLEMQALVNAVPQETRTQGETEYLLLEPLRQNILSQAISPNSLAEVASFANPPQMVLQVLNVVLCLYNEKRKSLPWKEVKAAIRVSGFVDSLKQKFASDSVHTIPPNPDYTAAWFNHAQAANVSIACGVLVQMTQNYLSLQQNQSPALVAWRDLQEQVKAVERKKRVYVRALQGMPEEVRKARATAHRAAPAHPSAAKKAGSHPKAGKK